MGDRDELVRGFRQLVGSCVSLAEGGNSGFDAEKCVRLVEAYAGFAAVLYGAGSTVKLGGGLCGAPVYDTTSSEAGAALADAWCGVRRVVALGGTVPVESESSCAADFVKTSSPVGAVRGLPRGPNYLRNQASRFRKKVQREEKKIAEAEARGRLQATQSRGSARPERTATEQELHELKVERQIIQEKRKLEKLKSPAQMIEDAMRQVAIAERCAKLANDSKVAKWAADLSSASAESIARSAGADVRTLKSGSSVARSAVVAACASGGGEASGASARSAAGGYVKVASGRFEAGALETEGVHHPSRVVGAGFSVDEFDESELCKTFSATLTGAASMSSDLSTVTRSDALKWLKRYEYLDKYYFAGKGLTAICKASGTSVSEVNKYLVFRRRFF